MSEEIRTQISNIAKETRETNATISHLNDEINALKGKLEDPAKDKPTKRDTKSVTPIESSWKQLKTWKP